jgi:hypothetical protein
MAYIWRYGERAKRREGSELGRIRAKKEWSDSKGKVK